MNHKSQSFAGFIEELQTGDRNVAAVEIFQRYTHRLIGLAHSRLNGDLKRKVDAEEVVQSVYRSFFQHQTAGAFEFESWEGIWALLTLLTLRKCYARVDYFMAGKRDIRLESQPGRNQDTGSIRRIEAESNEPTPEEAAMLTELVEGLMSNLDQRQQEIVSLTLQGFEVREISEQVGLSERTVNRVRSNVRSKLRLMIEDDGN